MATGAGIRISRITPRGRDSQSSGFPGPQAATRRELPTRKNGAPWLGRRRQTRRPGYQACTLSAVVGRIRSAPPSLWRSCDRYSPAPARLPRLVARGYPAAVYGPAVRDSFLLGRGAVAKPRARSIRYLNRSRPSYVRRGGRANAGQERASQNLARRSAAGYEGAANNPGENLCGSA